MRYVCDAQVGHPQSDETVEIWGYVSDGRGLEKLCCMTPQRRTETYHPLSFPIRPRDDVRDIVQVFAFTVQLAEISILHCDGLGTRVRDSAGIGKSAGARH